ncbi:uncharacterized protein DUF3180 [Herbihabitans rhizosphaerae]|uniref:Uncharacterized protein DUF3180 n=1 Tax=Herbihabitans rhizosphaerae TaxID=1872711 RepID=A0A4Q7KWQ7_9PSEU|nr:DUF3180 domain-containing protein [Herbihabitans rhizosphaerae]RZS41214.1 uncharacterized protein DUF3180 [Herbihabitans rhizosphaerae]
MKFTSARDLAVAGVIAGVLVYLLVSQLYGDLPRLPTFAGVTLLVLAVIELVLALTLRTRIRRDIRQVDGITVARVVALAKASSLLGAIMLGAWLAVLVYVVPERDELPAAQHDTTSSVIGAVCAGALIAAALWLEHCCRTPDEPDESREHRAGSG